MLLRALSLLFAAAMALGSCTPATERAPAQATPTAPASGSAAPSSDAPAVAAPSAAASPAATSGPGGCLTVLATNDLHGTLEPQVHQASGHKVRSGGMTTLSGYVKKLRDELGDRVLMVDGGDMYQGSLLSDHFEGRPTMEAMALLGYDAAVVGNHEFDFGAGATGGEDRLAVIKRNIASVKFPILGLNVFDKKTGKRVEWPNLHGSVLKEVAGLKVGIIGVATIDTPRTTKGQNVSTLLFEDPARLVTTEAKDLRERGAQLVVLVGHIGSDCSDWKNPHDVSSCDNTAELFTLLERLPPGAVDIAVGGHTHRYIAHWVHGVATIESGSHARRIGRIDACVLPSGGIDPARTVIHPPTELCMDVWKEGGCRPRETAKGSEPATFMGGPIAPMQSMLDLLNPYVAKIGELKEQKLGVRLPKALRRDEELGPLVAESLARHANTKLALENIGGVRDDLPGGDLTFGQVYRVLPFGNRVTVMQLSGAQLKSAVRVLYDKRRAPPYLHGLRFVRREDGGIDLMMADGSAVKDGELYEIATNDFLAKGGDGIDVAISSVTDAHRRYLDLSDRDAFIQLLKERFPLK